LRILVTGSCGFVGSHIVDVLADDGIDVVTSDLVGSSRPGHRLCDFTTLDGALDTFREVDCVCHLGAIGDVYAAMERPHVAAQVNALGTANICEACVQNGIPKLIYASTWEVYGEPHYQPIDEKHPCNPDHPYNITKLAGEQLAISYGLFKDLQVVSLRLGTTYGTRMRPNAVFSIFINRAMKKEPIVIQGSGAQFRQFTHTADVGRAFLAAAQSDINGEAFNIVSEEKVSIRQLAEAVCQELPTELRFEESRKGDIPPAEVSAEKAESELGWKTQIAFADGLKELIEFSKSGQ